MQANLKSASAQKATLRTVTGVYRGIPASDGAGVKLTRVIGSPQLNMLDPFLLLDVFESENPDDYIAGFPDHPHRGFETVTYLLAGRMRHADNAGNSGVIQTGGAQWMTAGRGIVHSEMPEQVDGLMKGVQLWINLPAASKGVAPTYRDVTAQQIPQENRDGLNLKVLAGRTDAGTVGPFEAPDTDPLFLDVSMTSAATFSQAIPARHSAFVYLLDGEVSVQAQAEGAATTIATGDLAELGGGDSLQIKSAGDRAQLLLLAARPLGEPVARGGPFVMNTREEIKQAFEDYASGVFDAA
jgi:redox-sensitive bicupin YhaK (pirin superfamily)